MMNIETPNLNGQVAIVTGAGRGLGREMAQTLAAVHALIAVVARSQDELDETVKLISQSGGTALAIRADISDRQAVEEMVQTVERQFGAVDLLVNNAGVLGIPGPLWEIDPEVWLHTLDVNLYGTFLCTATVMKGMVKRKRGRIINVSSSGALAPIPYGSAYCISKAALLRLTEYIAAEGKEHGVTAFAIDPGSVRTAMLNYLIDSEPAQKWLPAIHQYAVEVGVFNRAEESATLVALLASGKADCLSGRFIHISDNVDQFIAQTEAIQKDDLYTLRLRTLPA